MMQMTTEEIVRDYNAAANKSKQIKILADLNCVSSSEIRAVLAQAGAPGIKMPERIRQRKTNAAPLPQEQPSAVPGESVYARIETILDTIPKDASEDVRNKALDLAASLFSDYAKEHLEKGGAA